MSSVIILNQRPAALRVNRPQCQMICDGCKTLLNYPQGSTQVRCALCGYCKYVPPGGTAVERVQCSHCRELLVYPGGAHAVKCARCKEITCVTRVSSSEENDLVIVENPPTDDGVGRLVPCLCVGVARKRR